MEQTDLLREVDAFLKETGMGPTYFGRRACGNSEVVKRLRSSTGSVTLKTAEKIRAFIAEKRKASARARERSGDHGACDFMPARVEPA